MKTELKIKVGKFYRTRDGRKVRIYAVDGGGECPVHGAILCSDGWHAEGWTDTGACYDSTQKDHEDIVSEWVDKYPRNGEPAWATHTAVDKDGTRRWFSSKPARFCSEWCPDTVSYDGVTPPSHGKPFTGDWKDSLQELE